METHYDLIVIGGGACGIMGAIAAATNGHTVLLLEKLPQIAAKLKATGGGRCNLANTLPNGEFLEKFGRDGKFMRDIVENFDHHHLGEFFASIGVETHSPDGFRIFPVGHSSQTIIDALRGELERLGVTIFTHSPALTASKGEVFDITTPSGLFTSHNLLIATGGMGYPMLGASGDGYKLAQSFGHTTTPLYPAMMPLHTRERWVERCRADTLPKVELRVDLPKYKKLKAIGDLIFTKEGIRGPVVLDFSREITPLLGVMDTIPLRANLVKGESRHELYGQIKQHLTNEPTLTLVELLMKFLPQPLSLVLCELLLTPPTQLYSKLQGATKEKLLDNLVALPLTITGHEGFAKAMITRGGITLGEINPKTMESKLLKGLYFCGEVVNIDGPCGGYNLQWAFASGFCAGELRSQISS